jgi:mannosyltransferase
MHRPNDAEQRADTFTGRTGEGPKPWKGQFGVVALAAVVAAGIAIRGYHLSARSFWFDEAFSWRLTQFPLVEMLRREVLDNNPPLYFLLLKGWTALFGTSPLALRSLSVLLGGVTVVGMYLFAKEALEKGVGETTQPSRRAIRPGISLFIAALVAVSTFQIRWSWEARMYALGASLAALSSWALFRALNDPPRRSRWLVYCLFALLFAYTHYYAVFSIIVQAGVVISLLLARSRGDLFTLLTDRMFRNALLAGVILIAGWFPWVPFFLAQRSQVQTAYWSIPVTAWDVPKTCYQIFFSPEHRDCSHSQAAAAALACAVGLLALLWKARLGEWYLFWASLGPVLLSVLVSRFDTQLFHLRYFLFAHLFLLAGVGVLVWRIPFPCNRGFLLVPILCCLLGIHSQFWEKLDIQHRTGIRGAAEFIATESEDGEVVVVSSPLFYFPMLYHLDGRAGCRLYTNGRPVVHYEGGALVVPEDLISAEQLSTSLAPRVWVVNMEGGSWGSRAVPVPSHWVLKRTTLFPEVYPVQGNVVLVEYDASSGPVAYAPHASSPP